LLKCCYIIVRNFTSWLCGKYSLYLQLFYGKTSYIASTCIFSQPTKWHQSKIESRASTDLYMQRRLQAFVKRNISWQCQKERNGKNSKNFGERVTFTPIHKSLTVFEYNTNTTIKLVRPEQWAIKWKIYRKFIQMLSKNNYQFQEQKVQPHCTFLTEQYERKNFPNRNIQIWSESVLAREWRTS
jgi:hypothetical protein